jgi:CRISPR type III-A-associated protein Csm2
MSDNIENKIFQGITPLKFDTENNEIASQIQALESIVRDRFGKKKQNEKTGKGLGDGFLSTTQLRNLYDKIKQCKNEKEAQMLYPKVVYMAARQNNNQGRNIIMEIAGFIKEIKTDEQIQSFKKFMEAIVAFQKYYYPSKN